MNRSLLNRKMLVVLIGPQGSGKSSLMNNLHSELSPDFTCYATSGSVAEKRLSKKFCTRSLRRTVLRHPILVLRHLLTRGGQNVVVPTRRTLRPASVKKAYRRLLRAVPLAKHFINVLRNDTPVVLWERDGARSWGFRRAIRDVNTTLYDGTSRLSDMDTLMVLRRYGVNVLAVYVDCDDRTSAERVSHRARMLVRDRNHPADSPIEEVAINRARNIRTWYEAVAQILEKSQIPVVRINGLKSLHSNSKIVAELITKNSHR